MLSSNALDSDDFHGINDELSSSSAASLRTSDNPERPDREDHDDVSAL